jgi:hypothetical protein
VTEESDEPASPAADDPRTASPAGLQFDLKRFDVQAFLPEAVKTAQGHYADSELVAIDVQGVNPDGIVDFSIKSGSTVLYRFRSPERSIPPDTFPKNAVFESNCMVYVMVMETGINSYVLDRWACNTPITGVPRCSVKQIFAKAIAAGAPSGNVIGGLGFNGDMARSGGKLRWYVNVPPSFSNLVDDDC